ncbi:MAG: lytic transglycosylase domain-containing protein [Candidatus Aminicenantes bacterium]|nr:lytic transglycosylase domain-containing protein [Candidatus Aminicenantes bacterium]
MTAGNKGSTGDAGMKPTFFFFAWAVIVFLLSGLLSPAEARETQELRDQVDSLVKIYARKYNVPADLIHAIIRAESNYNSRAVSPKGAAGLMQLMPETASQYGVKDRFDPEENIMGGVKYLKDLCRLYNNNTRFVLAAYNAGQEALKKFKGIPPYPETREYISRVMSSYSRPFITGSSPVQRFVDATGQHVFTNDPYYHLNSRRNRD